MNLRDLFSVDKPLIGMVHLGPLPGSPLYVGMWGKTLEKAYADAKAIVQGGMHGFIIENFHDVPYHPRRVPHSTVAAMTEAGRQLRGFGVPFGINVLRNDSRAALSVAFATGASFIRINVFIGARLTDQGLLQATAYEVQREKKRFSSAVAIFADVGVKHSSPLGASELPHEASDAAFRGLADALIVSGNETGRAASVDDLHLAKRSVPSLPVLIGSGVTPADAPTLLAQADGLIVGTGIKRGGIIQEPIDIASVSEIVTRCSDPLSY